MRTGRAAPVSVTAPGARVPRWRMAGAESDLPLPNPVLDHGATGEVYLVPYGCARLRVTELPVIGNWHDRDDADDPQYAHDRP